MKIKPLNTRSDGTKSFEIRAGELSYRALIRRIKKIPEATVTDSAHDPLNDNAKMQVGYKGLTISIGTPFSDYIISCASPDSAFDEFISRLSGAPVRWWEHLF